MDFSVVSERVIDDMTEAMMIGRIRRYTATFENSRAFLIIGGKVHDNRWRRIGSISRAHYALIGRKGLAEFVAHLVYFASLVFVGTRLTKREPSIQYVTNPYAHYTLGTIAVVLAKITGRKAIVRVGSSISELLTRPGIRYRIIYSILLRLEQFGFDRADAIAKGSRMPLDNRNTVGKRLILHTSWRKHLGQPLQFVEPLTRCCSWGDSNLKKDYYSY